jgi:hypothetical protein
MMLEVKAETAVDAIEIAKTAGYKLDAEYGAIPMSGKEKSWVLRGEKDADTHTDDRITEWGDAQQELF